MKLQVNGVMHSHSGLMKLLHKKLPNHGPIISATAFGENGFFYSSHVLQFQNGEKAFGRFMIDCPGSLLVLGWGSASQRSTAMRPSASHGFVRIVGDVCLMPGCVGGLRQECRLCT